MNVRIVFVTLLFFNFVRSSEQNVEFYEELIKDGDEKSKTYQFPTNFDEYIPKNSKPRSFGKFDYVIIGAGSTGSTVAGKLSQISNYTILLLEAGTTETKLTDIPGASRFLTNSKYNWGINSTKQKNCCLSTGGICSYINGKVVGGSSTLSSLIYSRGKKPDYDKWAAMGNPGWAFKDVLPYYIELEDTKIKHDSNNLRGVDGPLEIALPNPISSKSYTYFNASEELGYQFVDYNGRNQTGVGLIQYNTEGGRRESAAKAFLKPSQNRTNLKILPESFVIKILISRQKKAYGVIFSHKNIKYCVKAKKEVVLSAGCIASPQILMLSGVGPRQLLTKYNITTKIDLDVGEKLLHHPIFSGIQVLTSEEDIYPDLTESVKEYLNPGIGPLTTGYNTEGIGFIMGKSRENKDYEVEQLFTPSDALSFLGDDSLTGSTSSFVDPWGERPDNTTSRRTSSITIILLYPKTSGRVYIKSNSPYEHPIFESQCLADPRGEDIDNIYRSLQYVFKLMQTKAFKKINARILTFKPCSHFPTESRDYWVSTIRHNAKNNYQGSGTCSMGLDPLSGAVVNHELKVYGIQNLRVADVSVVPLATSSHLNAVAMMIGLKAADLIMKDSNIIKSN